MVKQAFGAPEDGKWEKKSKPALSGNQEKEWFRISNEEDKYFVEREQEAFNKYVEQYNEELQAHRDEIREAKSKQKILNEIFKITKII